MAEEQAAPKQPFESRVEDLFSSAVEQQVAERRALGSAMREISELVGSLQGELNRISERLDSLEVRVGQDGRGVREAATAVQEGLAVAVARLTTAVTDQLDTAHRRDDEARTSLQRAVLAAVSEAGGRDDEGMAERLAERIGQLERLVADLASRPAPEPPAVPSAQAVAEAVVQAVAGTLPRPERLDVGHLAARLAAAVPPAPAVDVDAIVAAVAGAVAPPSAGELASAIAEQLPAGDIDDVTSALLEASRRHQQELTTTLVRELQLRLDLVADEVRDAVDGSAASMRTGLEALRQDADEAARRQLSGLRDDAMAATRQVVQDSVAPAVQAVGALREDLQQPWGMLDRLTVRVDGVVQAVEELRHLLEAVPERLAPLGQLGGLRQELSGLAGRLEPLNGLTELRDLVAGLAERQVSPEGLAEVRDLVAGLAERQATAPQVHGLREQVAGLAGQLQPLDQLDHLRDEVDAIQGRLAPLHQVPEFGEQLAELVERQGRLDDLGAGVDRVAARLGALDDVLSATRLTNDRLGGLDQLVSAVGGVRDQLAGLGDLGDAVEATHDRLAVLDQVLLALASIQERVAELDGRVSGAVEELGGQAEAAASGLRGAVESALRADQHGREAAAQDLLASVDERVDALTASVAGRLDEVAGQLHATLRQLEAAGEGSRDDLDRLMRQSDQAGAALAALREGVADLGGGLAGQTDTLAAMGTDIGKVGTTVGRLIGELQAQVLADQERIATQVRALLVESVERLDRAGVSMTAAAERAAAVLDDSTAGSAQSLDEAATRAVGRLEAALDEGTERVDDVATAASDVLRGTTADVVGRLDDATGAILDSAATLRDQLVDMLQEVTGEARLQTAKTARRIEDSVERLDGLYDAVQGFEPALVDYLIERDRQLDQQRVLLLRDLVEQLGASLTRRERKRLAGRLEPPSAPTPDGPAAFQPRVATRPRTEVAGDEHDEPPPPRAASRPRGPVAHREDLAELTAPPSSARSGPPITREQLLEVKGLGPARLAALVDEFGSIEAVAAASGDQLARVDGISGSLARAIHAAVADQAGE